MMLMIFALLFGMTAVADTISQQDCTEVDLSNRLGPIRDQGVSGSCFAFTAADLIGFSQGVTPGEQVSALDVQIGYLTPNWPQLLKDARAQNDFALDRYVNTRKTIDDAYASYTMFQRFEFGGWPVTSILAYNRRGGICTEAQLSSEGPKAMNHRESYLPFEMTKLEFPGGLPRASVPNGQTMVDLAETSDIQVCRGGKLVPMQLQESVSQINTELIKNVKASSEKACNPRRPVKMMSPEVIETPHPSASAPTARTVLDTLKSGRPAGIAYDASFLMSGRSTPFHASNHASSIVGMHWNAARKTCEFKLRNSWGESCGYAEGIRCDSDGYVWLDPDDINTRVTEVVRIK